MFVCLFFHFLFPYLLPVLFSGKVLTEVERHELSALAACIYVKEQLIARKFLNQTRLAQATNLPMKWSLSVNVIENAVEANVSYLNGKFEVRQI